MPRASRIRSNFKEKQCKGTYMHIQNMCVNMYISMWVFSGFKYQIFDLFSIGQKVTQHCKRHVAKPMMIRLAITILLVITKVIISRRRITTTIMMIIWGFFFE